ncbi:hypothetical protein Rhopal_005635-T1 [Rhodotorula paludigena]|uniref:Uncharacterized protein n=1 Tax=Rhodotorula paludigena TaxID=86838 RepID=A0AAV5GJ16_9BASI|nr:hypothetical protein Rhopal_005635-T1 [Rhodotorula paludigena]
MAPPRKLKERSAATAPIVVLSSDSDDAANDLPLPKRLKLQQSPPDDKHMSINTPSTSKNISKRTQTRCRTDAAPGSDVDSDGETSEDLGEDEDKDDEPPEPELDAKFYEAYSKPIVMDYLTVCEENGESQHLERNGKWTLPSFSLFFQEKDCFVMAASFIHSLLVNRNLQKVVIPILTANTDKKLTNFRVDVDKILKGAQEMTTFKYSSVYVLIEVDDKSSACYGFTKNAGKDRLSGHRKRLINRIVAAMRKDYPWDDWRKKSIDFLKPEANVASGCGWFRICKHLMITLGNTTNHSLSVNTFDGVGWKYKYSKSDILQVIDLTIHLCNEHSATVSPKFFQKHLLASRQIANFVPGTLNAILNGQV